MHKRGTALRLAADALPASSTPADAPGSPSGAGSHPSLPQFTPAPRHYRRNGWTPERQRQFIAALADTGCVAKAARRVGMARTRCYALRAEPGAESFREAWDLAIEAHLRREREQAAALYRAFAARAGFLLQDTVTPVTPLSPLGEETRLRREVNP